jgi:hypothetical protein
MPNITLNVDQEVIRKVRKIALDRNTTLTAMVRSYLQSVAERDVLERERIIARLESGFQRFGRDMGRRTWTREELYDR